MDIDPLESCADAAEETPAARDRASARLSSHVAITVALLATFLGVCKVKDDRDDQFDLSDALLAMSISMLAVTALTHKRWLFWVALVPTLAGVMMGLAGLLGWHLHPDALARLLS